MNLEQAIHQRWAADDVLAALLPAERVKTGRPSDSRVPYATVRREKNRTVLRTNAGDAVDEVTLRITVWHNDHDAGRTIVQKVKAAFDRGSFDLSGGDRVLQMCRTSDNARQHDDGLWQFDVKFLVQVYLPNGV